MGSKSPVPYVHRHPKTGHLKYRRRIPDALRPFIPGAPREFVRTLAAHQITDPGINERHQAAAIEYDLILLRAQRARLGDPRIYDDLTTALLDHLAHQYLATELAVAKQAQTGTSLKRPYDPRDDHRADFEESGRAHRSPAKLRGQW